MQKLLDMMAQFYRQADLTPQNTNPTITRNGADQMSGQRPSTNTNPKTLGEVLTQMFTLPQGPLPTTTTPAVTPPTAHPGTGVGTSFGTGEERKAQSDNQFMASFFNSLSQAFANSSTTRPAEFTEKPKSMTREQQLRTWLSTVLDIVQPLPDPRQTRAPVTTVSFADAQATRAVIVPPNNPAYTTASAPYDINTNEYHATEPTIYPLTPRPLPPDTNARSILTLLFHDTSITFDQFKMMVTPAFIQAMADRLKTIIATFPMVKTYYHASPNGTEQLEIERCETINVDIDNCARLTGAIDALCMMDLPRTLILIIDALVISMMRTNTNERRRLAINVPATRNVLETMDGQNPIAPASLYTATMQLAQKQYVDSAIQNKVSMNTLASLSNSQFFRSGGGETTSAPLNTNGAFSTVIPYIPPSQANPIPAQAQPQPTLYTQTFQPSNTQPRSRKFRRNFQQDAGAVQVNQQGATQSQQGAATQPAAQPPPIGDYQGQGRGRWRGRPRRGRPRGGFFQTNQPNPQNTTGLPTNPNPPQ
jgi:hypothetical protein